MKILNEFLPDWKIYIPENCASVIEFAAAELSDAIKSYAGLEISITRKKTDFCAIYLNTENNPDIKYDGFAISGGDGNIHITANTGRGVLNGVYTVLQKWGFRRTWQKKKLFLVPKNNFLEFPDGINNPDIEFRSAYIFPKETYDIDKLLEYANWLSWNRFNMITANSYCGKELKAELEKRGMILNVSEHPCGYFANKSVIDIPLSDKNQNVCRLLAAGNSDGCANQPLVFKKIINAPHEKLPENIRGVISFHTCSDNWQISNINNYILANSCWNTSLEIQDILFELAIHYFPEAFEQAFETFIAMEKQKTADGQLAELKKFYPENKIIKALTD